MAVDRGALRDCALSAAPLHAQQHHSRLVRGQALKESIMRAEVERLVEEIKQSVGLLRRHL
jgi:hypothetical protein